MRTAAAESRRPAAWPYPRLIAHRGAGKHAPENTLAAMRFGFEHGYRMVEFDAKLSSDDVPILMHDATLNRTTNARGSVARTAWRDLAQLDAGAWHAARFAGEPVPALQAIARWANANRVATNIEIKPCPGREAITGELVARAVARDWRDAPREPLLTSFSVDALVAARRAAAGVARGLLADRLPADWQRIIAGLDCIAISLNHRHLTEAQARAIKAAGLRLMVYTCNNPRRVERLLGWGVDGVITDAIVRCAPLLKAGSAK